MDALRRAVRSGPSISSRTDQLSRDSGVDAFWIHTAVPPLRRSARETVDIRNDGDRFRAQCVRDSLHQEAVLHVDNNKCGPLGIEIVEYMLAPAARNHIIDYGLGN